jgi:hypothetical protein
MPIVSAGQVIDKTLFLKRPSNFYRAGDVSLATPSNPDKNADKAKPISNKLPTGYSFLVDSFLKADAAKNRSNLILKQIKKSLKNFLI